MKRNNQTTTPNYENLKYDYWKIFSEMPHGILLGWMYSEEQNIITPLYSEGMQ